MKKICISILLVLSITFVIGCRDISASYAVNQEKNMGSEKVAVNYESYKGDWKLKTVEDEDLYRMTALEIYFGTTGITITQINNNYVKGSIYSVQGAPSYRVANVDFEGKLQGRKLKTSYEDEGWLYTGSMELTFENNKITANITRDGESTSMWGIPAGVFTFVRPIETEVVNLSDEEKSNLEAVLGLFSQNSILPFEKESLRDEMIINFVGINLGLWLIDPSCYGDKIQEKDGNMIFDQFVMNDLANRYFGVELKENKSSDVVTYKNGVYTVPALGGVLEYPILQIMMKDIQNEGIYYAIVDYMFDDLENGTQLQYQYLIKLQKNDSYTIQSIKQITSPIDFEMLKDIEM